jgi:dTDP-glucose 4,6-dehydratase
LAAGIPGEVYNIGGQCESTNLALVNELCALLDELSPRTGGQSYRSQITFVADRPGHDRRYAINADKIAHSLGWKPTETLASGLRKTAAWYLANQAWLESVASGAYRNWIAQQYGHHA